MFFGGGGGGVQVADGFQVVVHRLAAWGCTTTQALGWLALCRECGHEV